MDPRPVFVLIALGAGAGLGVGACSPPADPAPPPFESFDDAWRDLHGFEAQLAWLEAHPGVALERIGTSWEDRAIWALRIRSPRSPDADRPGVLLTALQHAREWISGAAAMHIAEQLVAGGAPEVLDGWDVWVVPVANPDGYRYTWTTDRLWRKSRSVGPEGAIGVDLNRNWGEAWGGVGSSGDPKSNNYRGPGAFSEPETDALRALVLAHPEMALHVDLHSPGQLVLHPWAHTARPTPEEAWLGGEGEAVRQAMEDVHGQPYGAGRFHDRLYPASGVGIDWTHVQGLDSYLLELRDRGQFGFLLDDEQRELAVAEAWAGFLTLTRRRATR